jgi:hypothetical protein
MYFVSTTSTMQIMTPAAPEVVQGLLQLIRVAHVPIEDLLSVTRERIEATSDANTHVLAAFLANRAASKDGALARAGGEAISAEAVGALLRVGKAAVHKAKDEGRLLAYQEPGKRIFLFPVFQFDGAAVAPWVLEVVDLVGNGFAALHFLTVERKSLKGDSYLTRLQKSSTSLEHSARISEILRAARRLAT